MTSYAARNCLCKPTVSPLEQLTTFIELVSTMEILVRDLFKPATAVFTLSATMSVPTYTPPGVFVRLIWFSEHPGIMFDKTDPIHRLQIKAIFLALNREDDWNLDSLSKL
jgi:hypothetical protein